MPDRLYRPVVTLSTDKWGACICCMNRKPKSCMDLQFGNSIVTICDECADLLQNLIRLQKQRRLDAQRAEAHDGKTNTDVAVASGSGGVCSGVDPGNA